MKRHFFIFTVIAFAVMFSNAYAAYADPSIGSGDGTNSILITDLEKENHGAAAGRDSISIGQLAESSHRYSIAIGYDAVVNIGNAVQNTDSSAIAIGHGAKAWGRYAIALGNNAEAGNEETHSASSSIAIGNGAKATGSNALALGVSAKANRYSTALGNRAEVSGEYSVAIGYDSKVTSSNSTAIGYGAKTESALSTAIGFSAHVYSNGSQGWQNSIAIGNFAETKNSFATAIGRGAKAHGSYSISQGYGASTVGSGSVSLGKEAKADGTGASAIGSGARAENTGAIALGYESSSSVMGGAALGAGSIADRITTSEGVYIPSGIDGSYVKETVIGNYGVVSIGNATGAGTRGTRQLTGVAAGIAMTDAVNVAQLKALDDKLDTFGASVADTLGGGLKYENGKLNGRYTLSGLEGSPSYDNVQKAIEDRQTTGGGGSNISSGANIIVAETAEGNYQVSLKEDIKINSAVLQKEAALTADSQEAVSGKQIYGLGSNIADVIGGGSQYSSENGLEVALTVNDKTYNTVQDALNAAKESGSWVLGVNGEKTTIANGGEFNIADGKNINIKTEADGSYSFNVVDNPEFSSVQVGDININQSGIEMGGNKITGLADGNIAPDSTDAVNGSQLWDAYRRMGDMQEAINVVGAHAAALSGLHPVDYNPYEPTTLSAAIGTYRDEYAVAVGVFHYARENVLFNLGASICSDGDIMGRAGISFAVGKGGEKKPELARDMAGMQQQMLVMMQKLEALEAENAQNKAAVKALSEKNERNERTIRELKNKLRDKR